MANRRMFSRDVVSTDTFLDMPISAQALFFHLGMEGDDDGFVKNPKTVMRMIGAKPDDLNILSARGFIIPFQSGVIAIRHWRLMNTLRNDRYKQTTCVAEREMLVITDGIYDGCQLVAERLPSGCRTVASCEPQHNITQHNLTEPNTTEDNEDEDNTVIVNSINGYVSSFINLSPTAMEELTAFLNDDHIPEDVVRYAVDFAIDNNKRSWSYVRAILRAFVDKGFKTLADVRAAEAEREKMKATNASKQTKTKADLNYQHHEYTDADFSAPKRTEEEEAEAYQQAYEKAMLKYMGGGSQ